MVVNRINNMKQCFYLIGHDIVGDDFVVDKIFLQEYDAIRWGRRLATKNPGYRVMLYKQEITRMDTLKYVKCLYPFVKDEIQALASKYNLEDEVQLKIDEGYSSLSACIECGVI